MKAWVQSISLLLVSLIVMGCNKETNNKPSSSVDISSMSASSVIQTAVTPIVYRSASSKNCDQYLLDYQLWVDKYIGIIEKYKANPKDKTVFLEYNIMLKQVSIWAKHSYTCNSNPSIEKKYLEIQTKLEKAASGL
jgi:hypothetical protein